MAKKVKAPSLARSLIFVGEHDGDDWLPMSSPGPQTALSAVSLAFLPLPSRGTRYSSNGIEDSPLLRRAAFPNIQTTSQSLPASS